MLKAVLSEIPTYAMTCFQLPVSLCNRIQSALTRFWWDSLEGKKKMCWVSWDRITRPKDMGGLGIRDIQLFNTALLAKQAWRIISKPEGLLARVLKGKYCTKKSSLTVTLPKDCSHGWRGIIAGRDLLFLKLGAVIGNGETISVWKSPWLSTISPKTPYGQPPEKYQDLVVADLLTRETKEWNIPLIEKVFPLLVDEITVLKPGITGGSDGYAWFGARSGIYSTRSGYFAAVEHYQNPPTVALVPDWKKLLWSGRVSPKLQLFLWKITQGALPTGANLQQRGLLQHTNCVRCGELETVDHIFLHCDFAQKVWSLPLFKNRFDAGACPAFIEALKMGKLATCLPPFGITSDIFPWVCWFIWIARNHLVFEGKVFTPEDTLTKAMRGAREWNMAQPETTRKHQYPPPPNGPLVNPDLDDLMLCYSDAAWRTDVNLAGFGCVFKSRSGVIDYQTSRVERHVSSSLTAEALALRWALLTAQARGYSRICFNTDCQSLLAAISSKTPPADLYGIIQDIDQLSLCFTSVSFNFVARLSNSAADQLAKFALCNATSSISPSGV